MAKDNETKSEYGVKQRSRTASVRKAARTPAPRRGSARGAPAQAPLAQAALEEFRHIFAAVRRHFHWVEEQTGVSAAQACLLAHVAERPGIRVTELARELAIHQSTASNLVERLEAARLLKRERDAQDQRVVRLHASALGRRIVEGAPQPLEGLLRYALKQMPERELAPLLEQLRRLVRTMDTLEEAQKQASEEPE
jgi:DNA-binding MarR family transcriptional regulator